MLEHWLALRSCLLKFYSYYLRCLYTELIMYIETAIKVFQIDQFMIYLFVILLRVMKIDQTKINIGKRTKLWLLVLTSVSKGTLGCKRDKALAILHVIYHVKSLI